MRSDGYNMFQVQVLLDHLTKDQLKVDDVDTFVNNGIAERFGREIVHRFHDAVRVEENHTPHTDLHSLTLMVFTPEELEQFLEEREEY